MSNIGSEDDQRRALSDKDDGGDEHFEGAEDAGLMCLGRQLGISGVGQSIFSVHMRKS
jgi:hypothetical protein